MPKIVLAFVFLLTTIAAPRTSAADDPGDSVSTKQWLGWCAGVEAEQLICKTYLSGFIHAITLQNDVQARLQKREPMICVPYYMTGEQVRRIVIGYSSTAPAALDPEIRFPAIVVAAMMKAFPCIK